jgi:hypothetical protein
LRLLQDSIPGLGFVEPTMRNYFDSH